MPVSSVSWWTRYSLDKPSTPEAWCVLVTISHPWMAAPIRTTSNSQGLYSRGNYFYAYPFQIELPSSSAQELPKATIRIDNVSVDIIRTLRAINSSAGPILVTLEVVRLGYPNYVEVSCPNFILNQIQYDALTITGDLSIEQYVTEPYPKYTYTPGRFPGLFGLVVPEWPSGRPGKP